MKTNKRDLRIYIISLLKRTWGLTRGLFWTGLWAFGLGLLLWYPMRWWPGDRLLPVRLTNYFMPWLLAGLVPALLAAGLAGRKWLGLTLAVPTIFIGLTFAPLFLPRSSFAMASSNSFKVMSYNIWVHNQDIAAVVAVIQQEQPDILLLQEASPMAVRTLKNRLIDLYPDGELYAAHEPQLYQAVISRYPLTPRGAMLWKGRTQKVLVDTPGGPIAVWNVHPYAPLPWSWQYQQISGLTKDIAAVDGPLIVGGDFNTTDQAETYWLVNRHLSNAHWEAGWGFGFTFPSPSRRFRGQVPIPSLIRIDHIFYNEHFFALNARTLPTPGGSDHLPVVAEFAPLK